LDEDKMNSKERVLAAANLAQPDRAPNGGYILAPCHVLQSDVPIANILAMSDTGAACYYSVHSIL